MAREYTVYLPCLVQCCSCSRSRIIEWLGVWRDVIPWQKSLDHKPRPSGVHRRQRAVHFTWVSEGELLLGNASRGRFLASLHCGLDLAALFARLTRRTVEGTTDRAIDEVKPATSCPCSLQVPLPPCPPCCAQVYSRASTVFRPSLVGSPSPALRPPSCVCWQVHKGFVNCY